jgi:putative peptidoglycan lipid II flippase
MQAPLGIFGQSLALAVFPALTQFYAMKKMDMFRNQFSSTLRTVLYITVPVSILMFVAAPQLVMMLFAYGKTAGKTASIGMVSDCLRMFSFGICAWCLHPVLMRGFFALQKSVTPIILGTFATGLFVGFLLILRATPLQYLALPLASSLSAIVLVILLIVFVAPAMKGLDIPGVLLTLVKSSIAGIAMAGVLLLGQWVLPAGHGLTRNLFAAITIFGFGLVGAWGYYFVSRLLKMPETAYIDRAIARLDRRRQKATPQE